MPDADASTSCPYPSLPTPIRVPLTVVPEHACPYLPGRTARSRAFAADAFPPALYHRFMDAGFRRSGNIFYQPICPRCRACMQIRVPVRRFIPSKSQRRCRRRNADLSLSVGRPAATDEKYRLYQRYILSRHEGPMTADDRASFECFLYQSPVDTIEVMLRQGDGRLLAVGICDVAPESLSSVYFYFDPEQSRRSLGTFGALVELDLAAKMGIPYYYLGYWIEGAPTMHYKSDFRPCEVLHPDGVWRNPPE